VKPAAFIACVSLCAGIAVGCQRRSPATAEAAELASLPIHVDKGLGADLRLAGIRVTTRPDRRSWIVTVYSTVLTFRNPRPPLWVHAYPQESSTYFTMDPVGTFPSADVGHVVKDEFLLKSAGAFNLYVGVTGADGSLGPAVGLGWVGVGDPDTREYHVAYRFLQEADDARAAAMLAQTQDVYPGAKLP
jgi:hypothetical protein